MKSQPNLSRGQQPRAGQQPPEPPRPVLSAVKVMYAGAALSAIELAIALATSGGTQSAIHKQFPKYTASQVHSAAVSLIAAGVTTQVLAIGLWLLMSWANRKGMSWARVTASGLFVLNTFNFLAYVRRPTVIGPLVLTTLVWVAGLGAIILLWLRDSSAFFTATSEFKASQRPLT
jgi:hypothetical protein